MQPFAHSSVCVHCGALLRRPDAHFCGACGKQQPARATQVAPPIAPLPPTQYLSGVGINGPHLLIHEPGVQPRRAELQSFPILLGSAAAPGVIALTHRAVTTRHARIDENGGNCFFTDLGSANGTSLNGQRLAPHIERRLNDGDILRIADAQGNSIGIVFRSGSNAAASTSIPIGNLSLGQKGTATLGRDSANTVTLDHPAVSRLHAEVRRSAQGDMLFDHSSNGTFVNAQRIRGRQLLHAGDVVQIGPFRLTYDQAAFTQIAATTSYRLDALHLTRQIITGSRLPLAKGAFAATTPAKLILNDVSLSIYPREFVALVGGSGAGKSTLMKALSGVTPATGHVLINGDDLYLNFAAYRSILGYVPQDDIVHQQLTVAGALAYAARLRLPDATPAEIDKRIDDVLGQVELKQHAAKSIHQLSGGQRKRVSIAVELLADPGLFFLDEPTSGLDPGLEKKMMHTLRRLADAGRTIILVTHATANIDQCDHVAFMADGVLAFYGPPKEALAFFNAQDFADIYTRLNYPIDPILNPPPPQWQMPATSAATGAKADFPPAAQVWSQCYQASGYCRQYIDQRLQSLPAPVAAPAAVTRHATRQKDSLWRQWGVLTQRYLDLIRRDAMSLVILLAVMPLIGLLLLIMANQYDFTGLPTYAITTQVQQKIDDAWLKEDDAANNNDQFDGTYQVAGAAQTLLFMLALAANLLGVFGAAYEIVKEEPIYQRERMVNLSLAPYLLSKIGVLAAFAALQCLLLLWVVQRKVEYPHGGVLLPAFGEMYVTLLLVSLAGIILGLLLSAVVRNQNTVIYLMLLVLFVQILFAGAIFKLPEAAVPLSYLTPTRWALEALGSTVDMEYLNELSVTCVEPENEQQRMLIGESTLPCEEGQQKLSPLLDFNVNYQHDPGHLLARWAVLLLLSTVFGIMTFYVQKRKDIM